jgi:hypothetical protein
MRQFMAVCGLAALLAAAGPALADDGVQLGATYRGVVQLKTYGSPQVPLPPGDWKLVALDENRDRTANTRMLQGMLIQVRTGVLTGRVIFDVPDSPSRGGWSRPAACDRKFLANLSQPETAFGSYDCLTIEPVTMIRASNVSQTGAQFYDYLDANKIKKPGTALSTVFNISDGRTYLNVSYLFNPDVEKITPAGVTAWHLDRYKEDAKRAAYVENVKNWAQLLRPKIVDGLKGRLPASFEMASVSSLPPVVAAAKAAPATASAVKSSVPSPEIGKLYRDSLQLDTYGAPQIPLPPGDWKLVVLGDMQSDKQKIRLVRGYLIQTKDNVMAGRVYFNVPDGATSAGWAPSENCKRKDALADLSVNAGSNKGYDCTAITVYGTGRPTSRGVSALNQFHDYLEANAIGKPPTMINVGYGISNGRSYVTAEYQFNPELEGVRADNTSAWRPERSGEDSRRATYVEKMKAWAQAWHPKIEAGFQAALPKPVAGN